MTIDKQQVLDSHSSDEEIESLRRELESKLEKMRTQFDQEQQEAFRRIELLSENSEKNTASEWAGYEIRLATAREELYKRSREEMFLLLGAQIQGNLQDEPIRIVLEKILPDVNSGSKVAEK